MRQVFFDLKGNLGSYAPMLKTEKETKQVSLIKYQKELNKLVKDYGHYPATKENCEKFWISIRDVWEKWEGLLNEWDKKDVCLGEIRKWIYGVGLEIAFPTHIKQIAEPSWKQAGLLSERAACADRSTEQFLQLFTEWYVYANSIDIEDIDEAAEALANFGKYTDDDIRSVANTVLGEEKVPAKSFKLNNNIELPF